MVENKIAASSKGSGGLGGTMTKYRWVICWLLFYVTTANYIDRSVFGNIVDNLVDKQHLFTREEYWYMQIAFMAAYAIANIFGGRIIDWLGLKRGFVIFVALWGLAAMSHAFAGNWWQFLIVRILLGLGEGGNFPAANKAVSEWFPKVERAEAIGTFNIGSNVGGIVVPIGLLLTVPRFGWQPPFLITGLIDLGFIILWLSFYSKPEVNPKVSKEELDYIHSEPPETTVYIPYRKLLPHRQLWSFAAGKGMTDGIWWFYLFSTADFLKTRFQLEVDDWRRMVMISFIYVLASVGSYVGGWLSGHFMKNGWTLNKSRKVTLLICAICVTPVLLTGLTSDKWLAVLLIAIAATAHQGWSANIQALASDMFPKKVVASVVGFGGMAGAAGGILLFYTVTVSLKASGYSPIYFIAAIIYLVALLFVHLLAPKLEPAKLEAPEVI